MFCEKCGSEVRKEKKLFICSKCGAKYGLDYADGLPEDDSSDVKLKKFHVGKSIIPIVFAIVLALGAGATAIGFGISNLPANRVSRYMGAAERYLSEMNYEQAIIEFQRILEIEPMNVDAHLGLAKAYIGLGDIDKAIAALQKGFELTGDERLKSMINQLTNSGESNSSNMEQTGDLEEQLPLKLSFTELESGVVYINLDHYICLDGELWRPCDINGHYISDKKFKYIENFCGTVDDSYTIVIYEDGKVAVIDKNYQETFEIDTPDKCVISNQAEPLILTWHIKAWNDDNDKDNLQIYSPSGTLLYKWNSGEYTDGSGKLVDINDPALPYEARSLECTEEYHKNLWVDSVSNSLFEYAGISVSGDKLYVPFCFEITYDYDNTEEIAAFEKEKQETLDKYGFWTGALNSHGHYSTASAVYNLKLERGELIWQKSEILSDYTPWSYNMGEAIILQDDDFVIINVINPTSNMKFAILSGNMRKGFTSRSDYSNNYELTNVNFNYVNRFINKDLMICGRYTDETRDNAQLAMFKINWLDDTVNNTKDEKILNEGHKRISDFYDTISYTDSDLKLGYALVSKDGGWGYISLETGDELAMFDDASNFSNGYAVVTVNGAGHIVDKDFNAVSDEFPCEGASTIGDGSFRISVGEEVKRLVIEK